jgi:GNAT superfamily N-acetyltransferase
MSYDIRPMNRRDLEIALGWAREEGWNPGLDDAGAFHAADPTGFLMGFVDGSPASCISVVKYGDGFAFLGLYIVRPRHRGKGLGKAIWDAGIASAGTRPIGLDGVVAQQENYMRSGFVLAHRSARWGGRLNGRLAVRSYVRPLGEADLDAILGYDRGVFPAPRENFLRAWLGGSAARQTEGYFDDGGNLRGYGSVRRCVEGWKIGPLFADTPEIAEALIATLVAPAASDPVFIDIPEPNAGARVLAQRLGFTPAFETARMYRGPAPRLPLERIFGITTLELG